MFERNISERRGENLWNSQVRPLISFGDSRRDGVTPKSRGRNRSAMPERIRPIEQMLELSEEEAMSPEHLDSQVQKAQEQLLQLKRQSEQIEKQKRKLEELSRRQEELDRRRLSGGSRTVAPAAA